MKITRLDVEHVAKLAKLHFNTDEFDAFTKDFQDIVSMVNILGEVDTTNVLPTYHGNDIVNAFREDVAIDSHHQASLLANAPSSEYVYIQVPVIIESEEA